jgi:tRNA pseudouridine38-40 synthase
MPVVRLDIEYDGTAYAGWAVQPGARTVQHELETALATTLRAPVRLTVAGRTDAGVHALGQVASFETPGPLPPEFGRSLNALTPRDIAVTAVTAAPDGFDARRSALSRTYEYRLFVRRISSPFHEKRALWWPHRLDREALDACAVALPGDHDFTAFTPAQTDHVRFTRRVFNAAWSEKPGDMLVFRVEADAFMRSMVRALVGTMLEASSGRRTVESFKELLRGAPRTQGGETAPPHGLYLISVAYP